MVGFVRGVGLDSLITGDNDEPVETPRIQNGNYQRYALYLFLLLVIFHFVYYLLVVFSLRELPTVLLSTLLSSVVTWILAILYQTLFFRKLQNTEKH